MVQVGAGGVQSARIVPQWCPVYRGERAGVRRPVRCPNGMPFWRPAQPLPRRPRYSELPA